MWSRASQASHIKVWFTYEASSLLDSWWGQSINRAIYCLLDTWDLHRQRWGLRSRVARPQSACGEGASPPWEQIIIIELRDVQSHGKPHKLKRMPACKKKLILPKMIKVKKIQISQPRHIVSKSSQMCVKTPSSQVKLSQTFFSLALYNVCCYIHYSILDTAINLTTV